MNSETTLDYALFQLSPRRSHCELFVWSNGKTEKLASGLMKPFVTHLRVAEEQFSQAAPSIKLEVEKRRIGTAWFNKGTLERFVRFVNTPEVLEMVNTFDAEMSQLEGARSIYLQGAENPLSGTSGKEESAMTSAADKTKKELLKAIDVRLLALKQNLSTACSTALSAGFTLDNISELLLFAQQFGAYRLNEACTKFLSLCQRRAELLTHHNHSTHPLYNQEQWKEPQDHHSSSCSDMSINDPVGNSTIKKIFISSKPISMPSTINISTTQQKNFVGKDNKDNEDSSGLNLAQPLPPPVSGTRRFSVQDRIKQFENKQIENPGERGGGGSGGVNGRFKIGGKKELRRVSSEVSCSSEKSLLRRWSGTCDMSIVLNTSNSIFNSKKEAETIATTSLNYPSHITANKKEDIVGCQTQSKSEDRLPSTFLSQKQYEIPSKKNHAMEIPELKNNSPPSIQQSSLSGRNIFDSRLSQTAAVEPLDQDVFQNQFGGCADLSIQSSSRAHFKDIMDKADTIENVPCRERELSKALQVDVLSNKKKCMSSVGDVATPSVKSVQCSSVVQFRTERKNEDPKSLEKVVSKSQSQPKEFSGKLEETSKGEIETSFVQSSSSLSKTKMRQEEHPKVTSSSHQGIKLRLQTSNPDKIRKPRDKRDERKKSITSLPSSTRRKGKSSGEALDVVSESIEPVYITKASKGALELNNELQMKADELEKLFSVHKLRVPGDNASALKEDLVDMQAHSLSKEAENSEIVFPSHSPLRNDVGDCREFDMNPMKKVGSSDYDYCSTHNYGYLNSLEDGRGKFYEVYMQKRDAKLRKEWGSKRAQKEASLKAMQDSLEHSRNEMKVKFSRSSDRSNSSLYDLRYNRAVLRNKEKKKVDFLLSEEQEYETTILHEKSITSTTS